jgi:hypothetical protein
MSFGDLCLGFYAFQIMAPIVLFQKIRSVQLIFRFPCVICFWVSFPFEEILKPFVLPEVAMTSDRLHLVLRLSID